jgi:arylsulfatase
LAGRPWELYNLETDRSELRDVAAQHPEVVERLSKAWHDWAVGCQVRIPPADVKKASP